MRKREGGRGAQRARQGAKRSRKYRETQEARGKEKKGKEKGARRGGGGRWQRPG